MRWIARRLKLPVIDCQFEGLGDGRYKIISFFISGRGPDGAFCDRTARASEPEALKGLRGGRLCFLAVGFFNWQRGFSTPHLSLARSTDHHSRNSATGSPEQSRAGHPPRPSWGPWWAAGWDATVAP